MQRRVVGSTCRAEDTATWSEIWRSDGEYTWPIDIFWWSHLINDDFVIHLEAAHIPRIAGILEAVLVALQEELQLEPGQCGHGHLVHSWEEARYILSWTLSGNVFSFWHMRQTHTRTCLPLTNKHSQTHIDIHKYTLIDTHKHIHTHKLTHTKTNACTQCFPIKAGYNLRSDWEWNVNLKKIRMQDLQGGFLTGSPLN